PGGTRRDDAARGGRPRRATPRGACRRADGRVAARHPGRAAGQGRDLGRREAARGEAAAGRPVGSAAWCRGTATVVCDQDRASSPVGLLMIVTVTLNPAVDRTL